MIVMTKHVFKNFSQSELDIQYNNRLRVPEVESLYKSWVSPSEAIFVKSKPSSLKINEKYFVNIFIR